MIKLTDALWHRLTATALKILHEALIALLCCSNKTDQSLPTVPSGPRLNHLILHVSPPPKTTAKQTGGGGEPSFGTDGIKLCADIQVFIFDENELLKLFIEIHFFNFYYGEVLFAIFSALNA